MSRPIIKLGDYYLEWSSIVDAPIMFGLTLEEFKDYYEAKYGTSGMNDLDARLERADLNGTSYLGDYNDVATTISCNHAGPDECELTEEELYQAYCLRGSIRDGWTPE